MRKFNTPAEAFNTLSPLPTNQIELGDGRILQITSWEPRGDKENPTTLPIKIEGFIMLEETPEEESVQEAAKRGFNS